MRHGARLLALAPTCAALIAVSAFVRPARADNIADAEELFRRAKALMGSNKATEACPLFKESYRLDPAQGTLLNLALCNEAIGKTGTAWGQFRAVEQQARRATPQRNDRIEMSKGHADKLEPRLSRVKLVVPPASKVPGLVVKVDGEEKGEPVWSGIVVDPGIAHTIEATAPKKKPETLTAKVEEGATKEVELKPLEDAPEPKVAAPVVKEENYENARTQKTAGIVTASAGGVVLVAGAVFGVLAITSNSSAKDCSPCVAGSSQAEDSNKATDRALLFGNVANIAIPVGVVAAAIGTYLVLSAGPTEKVSIIPSVTTKSASIDVVWRAW